MSVPPVAARRTCTPLNDRLPPRARPPDRQALHRMPPRHQNPRYPRSPCWEPYEGRVVTWQIQTPSPVQFQTLAQACSDKAYVTVANGRILQKARHRYRPGRAPGPICCLPPGDRCWRKSADRDIQLICAPNNHTHPEAWNLSRSSSWSGGIPLTMTAWRERSIRLPKIRADWALKASSRCLPAARDRTRRGHAPVHRQVIPHQRGESGAQAQTAADIRTGQPEREPRAFGLDLKSCRFGGNCSVAADPVIWPLITAPRASIHAGSFSPVWPMSCG